MPAKKLNHAQQGKIRELEAAHADFMRAKAELRSRIEAEFEARLRDYELRESRLMNEARVLEVPKTVIARAVGVGNWATLEAKYALTRAEVAALPAELPQYTLWPVEDGLEKGVRYSFTINWEEVDGTRYETPSAFELEWQEGVWEVYPANGRLTTELAQAVYSQTVNEVYDWRIATGKKVVAAHNERSGK